MLVDDQDGRVRAIRLAVRLAGVLGREDPPGREQADNRDPRKASGQNRMRGAKVRTGCQDIIEDADLARRGIGERFDNFIVGHELLNRGPSTAARFVRGRHRAFCRTSSRTST